ncbi:DNA-methyltransferase [endosymbiont GvMRE of Glomus versiforme]|uniref:DNA-methyltransferase n=1 Tax=endosymbiont GvMRE of Glomus versiforme TaxID=2039283 RepID=UPI001C0F2BF4|nr:site-specific DNA-methyltransferase [endosymbiont GvMRE of Glomus versiforme]
MTSLPKNSASLVFLDPQYEKVSTVLKLDYPLHFQSDYQISHILKEIERVLKPSGFCLLWVNKTILGTDRVPNWLLQASQLKIVDLLVWNKSRFGLGSWLRSQAEFAFLLQKQPTNSKLFKNRSFGNVWTEDSLPANQRKHPHQKPKELIKALIEATTQEGDLIIDPCAGSFIVLEACQETNREFIGCDLTFKEIEEFKRKTRIVDKVCLNCFEFV